MKFFIKTFGCQINNEDSNKIFFYLKKFFLISTNLHFDLLILNSCSVREFCQKKIFFFLKKNFSKFLIIITGCSSNLFFYIFLKKKYVNLIVNSSSSFYINYLIYSYYFYCCKQIILYYKIYSFKILNNNKIIISDGCNKYCSYCIIPYTRGEEIYEDLFFIFRKIFFLKKIFKELLFLGQNVNSYKFFLLKKKINFYVFLKIFFEIFNNFLFNYLTLNPKNLNFNIFFYKNSVFLHLPLQSASNKLLIFMKRNYNFNYYKKFAYFIKKNFSYFFFSTDILICFPLELNEFYNKTFISVEKLLFDKSYIFIYNLRSFTSSIFIINNINFILKKKRFIKIYFKLKNNLLYIKKFFINKIYFFFFKNICLNFNFLFFTFLNNRLVFFFFNFKYNMLNKFFKFRIKKFFLFFFISSII
ncbi:MAG: radical SAM protein [Candidatus Nasuia deltocephalinicola]